MHDYHMTLYYICAEHYISRGMGKSILDCMNEGCIIHQATRSQEEATSWGQTEA